MKASTITIWKAALRKAVVILGTAQARTTVATRTITMETTAIMLLLGVLEPTLTWPTWLLKQLYLVL